MDIFTHNHFSKIYWVIGILICIMVFFQADETTTKASVGVIACFVIGMAVKAMSHQVIVSNNKIVSKNLFGEKSILVTSDSRIYLRQSLQSYNVIIRHYDYEIHIVNRNESLKINANVNDADTLFGYMRQLEQKIILPKWIESFARNRQLKADDHLSLFEDKIKINNKEYDYVSLSSITLVNGQLSLKKAGKLWETNVLVLPVSKIPNLSTCLTIIHNTSGFNF